ncbi:MAG: TetR/AcrR family transcriptional regulator [Burkholderiaceae bacterium]
MTAKRAPKARTRPKAAARGSAATPVAPAPAAGAAGSDDHPDLGFDPLRAGSIAVPRQLPRGVGGLPHDVVILSQRARLVEGTAYAVADKGYAAATVADIIGHAGVSRTTFYQLFRDKEDCFLACFDGVARAQLAVLIDVLEHVDDPALGLIDGLRAYLSRLDADGRYARAFIAEAQAASPRVREAFDAARGRLDAVIRDWFGRVRTAYPSVPACTDVTHRLLLAALEGHVIASIRAGERELAAQAPQIAALLFAALGLYGWAETVRQGGSTFGAPRGGVAAGRPATRARRQKPDDA